MGGRQTLVSRIMIQLLSVLPWLLLLALLPILLRARPRLADLAPATEEPLVSIVVPARNEARNIGACVATLLASGYANREIIVVDDGSGDGTREIAEALAERTRDDVRVIQASPLPDGWVGKPWACREGVRRARGELLLFTDADTRHDPDLLERAVGALETERADLVSVLPAYPARGFWPRVVLPHLWLVLRLRYPSAERVNRARTAASVRVNGEFLLIRRGAYDSAGGHDAVRSEILSDLRLAQRVVERGGRVFLAHGEELLDGRAYASLPEILEAWSKAVAVGASSDTDPWLRPYVPALVVAFLLFFWVVPVLALTAGLMGWAGGGARLWGGTVVALSLLFWVPVYTSLRWRRGSAAFFPIGAAVAAWVFVRGSLWSGVVEWKGRHYRTSPTAP